MLCEVGLCHSFGFDHQALERACNDLGKPIKAKRRDDDRLERWPVGNLVGCAGFANMLIDIRELLVNIFNYVLGKIDEIVVGGHTNGTTMGIYFVSSEIAELPTTIATPGMAATSPGARWA